MTIAHEDSRHLSDLQGQFPATLGRIYHSPNTDALAAYSILFEL